MFDHTALLIRPCQQLRCTLSWTQSFLADSLSVISVKYINLLVTLSGLIHHIHLAQDRIPFSYDFLPIETIKRILNYFEEIANV